MKEISLYQVFKKLNFVHFIYLKQVKQLKPFLFPLFVFLLISQTTCCNLSQETKEIKGNKITAFRFTEKNREIKEKVFLLNFLLSLIMIVLNIIWMVMVFKQKGFCSIMHRYITFSFTLKTALSVMMTIKLMIEKSSKSFFLLKFRFR